MPLFFTLICIVLWEVLALVQAQALGWIWAIFSLPAPPPDIGFLSSPIEVLRSLPSEILSGRLLNALEATTDHCVLALLISWALGLGMSTLMLQMRLAKSAFLPILKAISGVPPVTAFPILLLLFKLSSWSVIALAAVGAFLTVSIGAYSAQLLVSKDTRKTLSRIGYSGVGVWLFTLSIVSNRLSGVVQESIRWTLILAVVGEMHGSVAGGIGEYIDSGRSNGNYPAVYLGMIACAVLSMVFYAVADHGGKVAHNRVKSVLLSV